MRRYYCECCETYQILTDDFLKSLIEKETNRYERPPEDYHWHGERLLCDFCNDPDEMRPGQEETWMNLIPDYETPEQYEKRTGKKWNGALYTKCFSCPYKKTWCPNSDWSVVSVVEMNIETENCLENLIALCAQSPEPPPDDWKPEEEEINPFKGSEDERNCRCNNCGARFKEGEIRIANGGKEFCPSCGVSGCIADEQQEDEE